MFVVAVSDPRRKGYCWVWLGLGGCDIPVFELIKHTGMTYCSPFSSADIFSSGMWPLLSNLEDPELRRLKCEDITFNSESMVVRVQSSKTDQFRDGTSLVIARTGLPTCPVAMMERYFHRGELESTHKGFVFRGVTPTKAGERLRKTGGLSYTRLRELLLSKISQLGYDPTLFSMHSLRAGRATTAANAGVEHRLFMRHGRWKSETAKDSYVKDSVERRLEVSKKLGI